VNHKSADQTKANTTRTNFICFVFR